MIKSKNFKLSDKVEIDGGTGLNFILVLDLKDPKTVCAKEYDELPTWRHLTNDLITFCVQNDVCLSYLAEQGTIEQGGFRVPLAPCAIEYIAESIPKFL